jgi:DNA-binding MarR family transcriptional regulator
MPEGSSGMPADSSSRAPEDSRAPEGFADPSRHSHWRPLRLLQEAMDADIGRVYAEARIDGLKPAWVMELLRLYANGPMTITELAGSVQRTHSAVSQKVAAMRAAGWVSTTTGTDARSKKVALTAKATRVVGLLAAEWRATEAALGELEAEIPYPLSRVVTDIEQALRRKSFHDRITEKLAQDPDWDPNRAVTQTPPGTRTEP